MDVAEITAGRARRLARRRVLAGLGSAALFAGPARARQERERAIRLVCPETGEAFADPYWRDGAYLPDAMRRIDWLMRDFHRNVVATIDPALIDFLHGIGQCVGTGRWVTIFSAFRTPETNTLLRREGMPAVSGSQHLVARAADIAIAGVGVRDLEAAALTLRAGGVGAYADYLHVDTGPVREWGSGLQPHGHPHRRPG